MGPFVHTKYSSVTRQASSWYSDASFFVIDILPWFMRGGSKHDGLYSGNFAFYNDLGISSNGRGFRTILIL